MTPHRIECNLEETGRRKRCREGEDPSSHDEIPSIIFIMPKSRANKKADDVSTVITYDSEDEFLQQMNESLGKAIAEGERARAEQLKLLDDINDSMLALLALAAEFVAANSVESDDDDSSNTEPITMPPARKKKRTC